MSLITLQYVFTTGSTIIASQHNTNNSTIYNDYNGNITDANIAANAAIEYSKLSLNNSIRQSDILSSTVILAQNLPVGTASGDIVQLVSGTTTQLPAVGGSLLTGVVNSLLTSGTSTSASTTVLLSNLKIVYGTIASSSGSQGIITNLPFTSSTSYVGVVANSSGGSITSAQINKTSGSQCSIQTLSSPSVNYDFILMGT